MHYLILIAAIAALVWVLADKLWTRTRHLALRQAQGEHALSPAQVHRLQRLGIIELRVFDGGPAAAGRLLQHTRTELGEAESLLHAQDKSAHHGRAMVRRTEAGYELRLSQQLAAQPPEVVQTYVEAMLHTAAQGVATQRRCQRGQAATVAS